MADIFVSYSRTDKARVAPLVKALESQGWSVWWDPEITPGDEFDAMIAPNLNRPAPSSWSGVLASVDSRWVKGEARDAADRGVLVPVRFENALPPDRCAGDPYHRAGWLGKRTATARHSKSLCVALQAKLKLSAPKAAPDTEKAKRPAVFDLRPALRQHERRSEQEYFSDGITEDIITDLSKVSALSVVSRATAFSFKGETIEVAADRAPDQGVLRAGGQRAQGGRSGADHRTAGRRGKDAQVWAERYDRDLNDIFALQDEISKAIVTALKLKLLPEKQALERRGTTNLEAYKHYLLARRSGCWTTSATTKS